MTSRNSSDERAVMSGEIAELAARHQLAIPIRPHVVAVVDLPFPMTEADWGQMMAVLEAMKPGIVVQPAAILEDEAPGEQITAILKAARDTAIAARNEPMTPGTGSGSEEAAE